MTPKKKNVAIFTATIPETILKVWSEAQAAGALPRCLHGS
jgi:hypothetical protein